MHIHILTPSWWYMVFTASRAGWGCWTRLSRSRRQTVPEHRRNKMGHLKQIFGCHYFPTLYYPNPGVDIPWPIWTWCSAYLRGPQKQQPAGWRDRERVKCKRTCPHEGFQIYGVRIKQSWQSRDVGLRFEDQVLGIPQSEHRYTSMQECWRSLTRLFSKIARAMKSKNISSECISVYIMGVWF